ncbi:hypothetical protein [Streptosporangium sp. NPDC003464]
MGRSDHAGAAEALPGEVVDGLSVNGTPEECRERIARFHRPGVTSLQLYVSLPREVGGDPEAVLRTLRELGPG